MDGRRRRFVPLSVHFAHGETGTTLLREFGTDGLLVWVCLIAAAKRSPDQGTYLHITDAETWATFGIASCPPSFTFEDFLLTTGKLRQTSKRRSGRILYVSLTRWDEWNKNRSRQTSGAQNPCKTQDFSQPIRSDYDTNSAQIRTKYDTISAPESESESEYENDIKQEPPASPPPPSAMRRRDLAWDAVANVWGELPHPSSKAERSKRNAAVNELRPLLAAFSADPVGWEQEIRRRANILLARWRDKSKVTPHAVAANWHDAGGEVGLKQDLPEWARDVPQELVPLVEEFADVLASKPSWWDEAEDGVYTVEWVRQQLVIRRERVA